MDIDYNTLDPGIVETVARLHRYGWVTSDSGDGVSKPEAERVFHVPHVVCPLGREHEGELTFCARELANVLGDGWVVEASYSTRDHKCLLIGLKA
jgi:hypothetical protein